ncbi:DUF411 domain-containing protein [Salisaeta longa]|uniref:DUF411 domain-containing protein n=1 Tax=Salisaeta longa TaxID=503170 RepID=UPI0003B5A978|nr:DUF411 domain-containing protein [Salisaeta longa]
MSTFPTSATYVKVFGIGLVLAALGLGGYTWWQQATAAEAPADAPTITVYKSPTCTCCGKWVDYLKANDWPVEVKTRPNVQPTKQRLGVPRGLRSCHTATVGNYVLEGHVPAPEIKKLLAEKPNVRGLTVPGMPVGSPGMEGPNPDPYNVVAFLPDGRSYIFTKHQP